MGKFVAASEQEASVVCVFKRNTHLSAGTCRNDTQALTCGCESLKAERLGRLRELTPEQAQTYLALRRQTVRPKTLNLERQVIPTMRRHMTGKLRLKETLPVIQSAHKQVLYPPTYTPIQVDLIKATQTPHNALATAAGLSAHERFTLRPMAEQSVNSRPRYTYKQLDERQRSRLSQAFTLATIAQENGHKESKNNIPVFT